MVFIFEGTESCHDPIKIVLAKNVKKVTGKKVRYKVVFVTVRDRSNDKEFDMAKSPDMDEVEMEVDQDLKLVMKQSIETWHIDMSKAPCLKQIKEQYYDPHHPNQTIHWFHAMYVCAEQYIGIAQSSKWAFKGFTTENTREIKVMIHADQSTVSFDPNLEELDSESVTEYNLTYGQYLHVSIN